MRPKITIHADISRNTWLATFHDDQEVQELFGTDTLPTSFTLLEEGEVVRREIERKNPSDRVRLVHRNGTVYDPEDARDHPPKVREDQHGEGRLEVPNAASSERKAGQVWGHNTGVLCSERPSMSKDH